MLPAKHGSVGVVVVEVEGERELVGSPHVHHVFADGLEGVGHEATGVVVAEEVGLPVVLSHHCQGSTLVICRRAHIPVHHADQFLVISDRVVVVI